MTTRDEVIAYVRNMHTDAKASGVMAHECAITSQDSLKTYSRILKLDLEHNTGMSGVSRASWHVHRAALLSGYALRYQEYRRDQDNAQRRGEWDNAMQLAKIAQDALRRFEGVQAAEKPATGSPRKSKRLQLPNDPLWRAKAYKAASDELRPVIAVLLVSGARPAEIETGVVIEINPDGDPVIWIRGAKVSAATKAGQDRRGLTVSRQTPEGRLLAKLAPDGPLRLQMPRRLLSDRLERLGRKLGHVHRLSAYTFRHAAAADLKANGDQEMTALALGHASAVSQRRYGHANQSKAGSAVVKAQATVPVRRLERAPMPQQLLPPSEDPGKDRDGPSL